MNVDNSWEKKTSDTNIERKENSRKTKIATERAFSLQPDGQN